MAKRIKKLKFGKNVFLSYHTNWYDGLLGGYCWYNGKYCSFDCVEEKDFKYLLKAEEIEECKAEFKKQGLEWCESYEWEYTGYRTFHLYPFKTDNDAVIALGQKAIWEEYVGFQNSHNGTIEGRFGGRRYEGVNRNDWLRWKGNDMGGKAWEQKPYQDIKPEVDKETILGQFTIYDETKELKKQGYKLIECD